jgi:hypothetical protein
MAVIITCSIIAAFGLFVFFASEKQKKAPLLNDKKLLDE